jgi:hypothetical protein
MPHDAPDPGISNKLSWAGRVWANLTRTQCAGVLHIALRYGESQDATNRFIDRLAMLAWGDLGQPLQLDVTRALLELQTIFGR